MEPLCPIKGLSLIDKSFSPLFTKLITSFPDSGKINFGFSL